MATWECWAAKIRSWRPVVELGMVPLAPSVETMVTLASPEELRTVPSVEQGKVPLVTSVELMVTLAPSVGPGMVPWAWS
jgi:hypothetical protein